ncbi:hypothetical protein AVEN_262969-1 [Araneus ventricosus]|uniref:Fatty acyl-CoA reductase C-terminal domain-containing protein n=1 Tax=Araneus ventricosus TaxID=182803 RepID=A0A4Y2DG83_ARAVE|nr:hypothetical protein AVEN_262969-1 [Araneus ventricosus]
MNQLFHEFPFPKSFEHQTNSIIVPEKYLYFIIAAYYHYLPAIVLDGMLRILRKKPWIYSLYRYFDKVMSSVNFFQFHTFEFERNNLEYLDKLIHPEDRKDLTLDFRDATILGMALSLPEGSPFYDWKIDKNSQWERQRITHSNFPRSLSVNVHAPPVSENHGDCHVITVNKNIKSMDSTEPEPGCEKKHESLALQTRIFLLRTHDRMES